jgi:hypothetical protein
MEDHSKISVSFKSPVEDGDTVIALLIKHGINHFDEISARIFIYISFNATVKQTLGLFSEPYFEEDDEKRN